MWSCPSRRRSLLMGAGLMGAMLQAQAAPWFGEACPATVMSVMPLPAAPTLQMISVRLSPLDAGDSESLLVTSDGRFWATAQNLNAWHLPRPDAAARTIAQETWFSLEAILGLQYRFDACTQELWLDVSGVAGVRNNFSVNHSQLQEVSAVPEPGGHLNLDLVYLQAPDQRQLSGTGEMGFFSAQGHGLNSFLYDGRRLTRLETQWSRDWPDRLERLTLGDAISRGGLIGQSLRYGGIQWGTEFSLQPNIITFPLPSLRGQAALPSAVDVYVNNVLRAHQDVPAGNFELNNVPVMTGSGDVQLVVRDLLGRSQVVSYPFYATQTLLRVGLTDYSLQAGYLRSDYGFRSDNYGPGFVAGRFRDALDNQVTGEVYGELASAQQMAGAALSGIAPQLGNWSFGFASSHSATGAGYFGTGGIEHVGSVWNAALQVQIANHSFAQLGQPIGSLRMQTLARLGFAPHPQGMINLSYLRDQRRDRVSSSILGVNYGLRMLRDWYLNAGITDVFGASGGVAVTIGLTHSFGSDKTFSAQENDGPGSASLHRLSLQRDPPSALGFGYRVATDQGSSSRNSGSARWTGEKGALTADAENLNGNNSFRLGVASAFALLGRDLFWTRPVDSSFAVVDGGASGVRIYQDNRLAGRSRDDGLLLIPGLRAYERNDLRIEDADLPLRYSAQTLTVPVIPPAQSGLRVSFPVSGVSAVNLHLRRASGEAVPLGAALELDGHPLDLPVGFGGQALIEANAGSHRLRARWPRGRCDTLLVIAPDAGADLPAVSLECRE